MEPFVRETGLVAPLDRVNVDTDQIIPKQFLKRTERRSVFFMTGATWTGGPTLTSS